MLGRLREDSSGEWTETKDKTLASEEERDSVGQSCHTEKDTGRGAITSGSSSTHVPENGYSCDLLQAYCTIVRYFIFDLKKRREHRHTGSQ